LVERQPYNSATTISRCKAGIDLDGQPFGSVIQEGLHQPFMFVLSDHSRESNAETRQIRANIQSIYDHLPPDGRCKSRSAAQIIFSSATTAPC